MVPIQIAPMMEVTDRWFRRVIRVIAPKVELWTEMVVDQAIAHGDPDRLLGFDDEERPLVLQVGGDDPHRLAHATRLAAAYGYDSINLNVGCPSSRVQAGCFGAALMRRPDHVRRLVEAMAEASELPVHVKHRIGVDELDRYEDMLHFVDVVAQSGACTRFTVHARKAWLAGLSPKQNRDVPPLRHHEVHRLKSERPDLVVVTNGGLETTVQVEHHLSHVDGVMVGRAAVKRPWWISSLDRIYLGSEPPQSIDEAVTSVAAIVKRASGLGHPPHRVTRHLMHWMDGRKGARAWRRALSEHRADPDGGLGAALRALPGGTSEVAA